VLVHIAGAEDHQQPAANLNDVILQPPDHPRRESRFTNPRLRVCCGGSSLSIISRSRSTAASGCSRKFAVDRAEEKISGCRDGWATSSCLVTAPEPGPAWFTAVGVPERRRVLEHVPMDLKGLLDRADPSKSAGVPVYAITGGKPAR
jgi:hypothetical protein